MLISFWLIFNHSYNEKPALYYILYYLADISTNVYIQLVEEHCLNSVETSLKRYKLLNELGDGTCGSVYKAVNIETSEIVAVKKMKRKFYYWEECVNLREVKSLRRLNHPNVIKLLEIVRQNNELFFIFEYMNIPKLDVAGEEMRIKKNLLVTNNTIKIADFGLARELSSTPPFTDYVSTRWYRAPEVLLQSASYTPAIDMWAVGAILAELFTSCPIFPGERQAHDLVSEYVWVEIDQLYKICCVLGRPDWNTFPEATNISRLVDITYSDIMPANLSDIIPNASLEAIDLIKVTLIPLMVLTGDLLWQMAVVSTWVPRPPADTLQLSLGSEPNLELNLWDFGTSTDDCFLGLTLAVKPSAPSLEMAQKNQGAKEDVMICPGFIDHSQQSVFWSLFPSNHHVRTTSVEPSLSLSFSSVPNASIGGPQSAAFAMASFQSNILDGPLLATSSPFPQGHFL
ncbi:hypothetical protein DH2020_000587 [Rehmannia glutinosa]|uniref:Protein kinase domain-containing protein n=1 Tax=Rehmannia glutinosa TaxID=99300 RepID=A0ABR0XXC9_REHGL